MKKITIVTHNGNFHADDVFSIAALKMIYSSFTLIRSRDVDVINKADIVIDVGGEYDADNGRFDHHQRGGAGHRENGIPYSSFGLIWKKYGLAICKENQALSSSVDDGLVSVIDAIDCGHVEGVSQGVSLSHTISMFNPTWQEESSFDECFDEAVKFASRVLTRFIATASGGINARDVVAASIKNSDDPRLIILQQYTPWKRTVHALSSEALYIVYPSETGQWRIQAVPVEPGSFEDRKSLPEEWAGLSGKEFKQVTGLHDANFCHNGLFIAGADSYESILIMAKFALERK